MTKCKLCGQYILSKDKNYCYYHLKIKQGLMEGSEHYERLVDESKKNDFKIKLDK